MTLVPSLPRPPVDVGGLPGRSVDLERVDRGRHGAALWRAIGDDPSLWAGTPVDPFVDEAAFAAWLGDRAVKPDQAMFAIVDKTAGTREAAGLLFILSIAPAMGTAEIGLVFGIGLQRRTGATEAVFLALRHLFETLGYRRVE